MFALTIEFSSINKTTKSFAKKTTEETNDQMQEVYEFQTNFYETVWHGAWKYLYLVSFGLYIFLVVSFFLDQSTNS